MNLFIIISFAVLITMAVINNKQQRRILKIMAALDDKIAALTAEVASDTTVIGSAVALINGFAAQLAAAVAAAQAAGATDAQLQSLNDLTTSLNTNDTALAAAVAANTPPPAP